MAGEIKDVFGGKNRDYLVNSEVNTGSSQVMNVSDIMKRNVEYSIIVNEDDIYKNVLKNIFNSFNNAFMLYKSNFGQNPDSMVFSGSKSKKLFEMVKPVFSSSFSVSYEDNGCEEVIMMSKKTPVKKTNEKTGIDTSNVLPKSDRPDGLVPYEGKDKINAELSMRTGSLNINVEKEEETAMHFPIEIRKF